MKKILLGLCVLVFCSGVLHSTTSATKIEEATNEVLKNLNESTKKVKLDRFAIGSAKKLTFYDPSDTDNSFLDKIIRFIGITMGTFSVTAIAIGSYYLVIANGDQNQITKGKSILTYALIGAVMTFFAYYIIAAAVKIFTAS